MLPVFQIRKGEKQKIADLCLFGSVIAFSFTFILYCFWCETLQCSSYQYSYVRWQRYVCVPSWHDIHMRYLSVSCPTCSHPCWSAWIGVLSCCWRTGSPVQTCCSAFTRSTAASWSGKEHMLTDFKEAKKNT